MNRSILVTGGAGYIGSVLVRLLLEDGFEVRVLDSLRFGGKSLLPLLGQPRLTVVKGDIRDFEALRPLMAGCGAVVHLAAVVGDPACAREPEMAEEVNVSGSLNAYRLAEEAGVERFVFASTCSNYGRMSNPDAWVDERSELKPVSLYAETKVAVEQFLLERPGSANCRPTALRFATVYGLSPRMRFDLTVNEFTRELVLGRELVVFGEQFWRPYCHVRDLARSVLTVLKANAASVAGQVFNVGDSSENYQKQQIVDLILEQIPDGKVRYVTKSEDPRDYRVSFTKIREELGFEISRTLPDGVREIKRVLEEGFITDSDNPSYANVPPAYSTQLPKPYSVKAQNG